MWTALIALSALAVVSLGNPTRPGVLQCWTSDEPTPNLCIPSRNRGPIPLKQTCMATFSKVSGFDGDCWEQQEISLDQCGEECLMEEGGDGGQFCCCFGPMCNHPSKIRFV